MGDNYLTAPLLFLIEIVFGLYTLIVLLRFLLQLVKADFHNPISQLVVRASTPLLRPLRRFIPSIAGMDMSSLVLAWLVKTVQMLLTLALGGLGIQLLGAALLAIPELVELTIDVFLFAILISVVLSWINPGQYNPASAVLYSLTEPLLRPARQSLPAMGGLDLSPMLVMVGLVLLKMLLLPPLRALIQSLLG